MECSIQLLGKGTSPMSDADTIHGIISVTTVNRVLSFAEIRELYNNGTPIDPYQQANIEAEALMEMDQLEVKISAVKQHIGKLTRDLEEAAGQYKEFTRRWNALNRKCGLRKRAFKQTHRLD